MKLLVSDYDLTLNSIDYDVFFNMYFVEKFRKEGNLFFLNTGRSYESIKKEISKYRINFDYLACCDGNLVLNRKMDIISCTNLSLDIFNKISDFGKKYNNIKIEAVKYQNCILEIMIKAERINDQVYNDLVKFANNYDLVVKRFKSKDFNGFKLVIGDSFYVGNKDVSKSSAIHLVSELENISKCDIFTIGDHLNDLEMIRDFNGYTLPWGKKAVKEISQGQVLSVASLVKKIMR